jgi:hypothetical protein
MKSEPSEKMRRLPKQILYKEDTATAEPQEWVLELTKELVVPYLRNNGHEKKRAVPVGYMLRRTKGSIYAILVMRSTKKAQAPGPSPYQERWKNDETLDSFGKSMEENVVPLVEEESKQERKTTENVQEITRES